MRKQTALLLIILLSALSLFLVVARGRTPSVQGLLAQIGVVVGVAPNPYNTLNAQLDQEQDQLNQQAADLAAREAAFANGTKAADFVSPAIWYLAGAIAIVALLVLLNFYLDRRRSRQSSEPPIIDLEKPKE